MARGVLHPVTVKHAAVLVLALSLTGCLAGEDRELHPGGLQGGVDDRDRTYVGQIAVGAPGTNRSWCTATLVAARVLASAKHCLKRGVPAEQVRFFAGTGLAADTWMASGIGLFYQGEINADDDTRVGTNDFVAIALDRPPPGLTPFTDLDSPWPVIDLDAWDRTYGAMQKRAESYEGRNVILVGYSDDSRKTVDERIESMGVVPEYFRLSHEVADSGDSGGPVFFKNARAPFTGTMIGVISGGRVMTRLADYRARIDEAVRLVARTPALTGTPREPEGTGNRPEGGDGDGDSDGDGDGDGDADADADEANDDDDEPSDDDAPVATFCGDSWCDDDEDCDVCATDCGGCDDAVEEPACGDSDCGEDEDCASCSYDCGTCSPSGSCWDLCGGFTDDCACDDGCEAAGDCCDDWAEACG